jgi:myo-inositol-1(or 4)-monophosphatase
MKTTAQLPPDLLAGVRAAALEAQELIRRHDDLPRRIRFKSNLKDLLTETDGAVEALLRDRLAALLPEAGFLGEEGSPKLGLAGLKWVVDPVDGTTNFAHGVPFMATSIALCQDGEPLLGVVNLPLMGELFEAQAGNGARLNGREIHVSEVSNLAQALVSTGFPNDIARHQDAILRQLSLALPATQGVRRAGAAALDLAFVACGRYDAFFEFALNPWDTAAGVLLVREAGGRVGVMTENQPYELGGPNILVSNAELFGPMQELLTAAAAKAP